MQNPKISIITASYNAQKTIAETFQSVLDQDYENIEFIIIDAASTDDTISIIQKFEPLFNGKLIWLSEEDKGIYDAWNKGVKISSGEWIMFLGSDDILTKSAITTYVESIRVHPDKNFVSSQCQLVNQDLVPLRIYGKHWGKEMNKYCTIAHVASLHHKSLFFQRGYFNTNYKIAGDYDFLLRCRDIVQPHFIPVIIAKVREGGISGRNIFEVSKERLNVKIANKSRMKIFCYIDYLITIIKFYVRNLIVNPIVLKNAK